MPIFTTAQKLKVKIQKSIKTVEYIDTRLNRIILNSIDEIFVNRGSIWADGIIIPEWQENAAFYKYILVSKKDGTSHLEVFINFDNFGVPVEAVSRTLTINEDNDILYEYGIVKT
jgi:hypothetical protein